MILDLLNIELTFLNFLVEQKFSRTVFPHVRPVDIIVLQGLQLRLLLQVHKF